MHNATTQLDPPWLAMLRCPVTRSPLRQVGDELVSEVGGLRYPIEAGIAILLADRAKLPAGCASMEDFLRQFADKGQP